MSDSFSRIVPGGTEPDGFAADALSLAVFLRANRLVSRLLAVFGGFAVVAALFLAASLLPIASRAVALAKEAAIGGMGGIVLAALLLATTGLGASLLLTLARRRPRFALSMAQAQDFASIDLRGPASPGFAARVGQAVAVPVGAVAICVLAWLLWPAAAPVAPGDSGLLAAFAFGLAFIALVSERVINAVSVPQLAEAPGLRRLLLLVTVLLALGGGTEVLRGAGLAWEGWVAMAAILVPCLVAAELAVRAAARLFLPAPANERATAMVDSILAAVLTGGPRAPASLIKTHLGVDFARSWALYFLARALLPAVFLTLLLCWGLSGLKLIDGDQRGVYQRLGAPVAVLGPGLHLLLPWPLGQLRPVELGVIHTIATGTDAPPEAGDQIGAEAMPPESADRLWTTQHDTEVNYLVANQSGDVQSVELVSTEILVLYRTGLTDRDALEAVYGAADPQAVVKQAAARLVTRYFGQRSLDQVIGVQPQTLSDTLRRELAADVAAAHAGIEILAVVIEEIHPPAGAAAAYHRVQAAEIDANASIANEQGRATRMRGVAAQEAQQMADAADATARETLGAARASAYGFNADRLAYGANPGPFVMERQFADLASALAQTPLTLVDHRIAPGTGPVLDLRGTVSGADLAGGAAMPEATAGPPKDNDENPTAPGTFTYVTPNSTADTTPQTPYQPQTAEPDEESPP